MMRSSVSYHLGHRLNSKMRQSPGFLLLVVSFASFTVYTCMYGFRKPYTAGVYEQWTFLGLSYKVCLVIAQVIGYMISKFIGIRIISTMDAQYRIQGIFSCIALAWFSLFLFGIIPAPYNIICMFLNGLPLGMVFGMVFSFLEGRRTTEIMGAVLVSSFIFASGLAKSIGKWLLLNFNIHDFWMPFIAGAFFVIPVLISLWLLHHTPLPDREDIQNRSERKPMTQKDRSAFIMQFGYLLLPVVISYTLFTIVRDFSEDFANELWIETGYKENAGIFFQTSSIVAVFVLIVIGSFFTIKSNRQAFIYTHLMVIAGLIITLAATLLYNGQQLNPLQWMVISTTGLYLAYLPFNCLYFERMISTYEVKGNVGFVMYIADAFGYLGTVFVLLLKEFIRVQISWVSFFSILFIGVSIMGVILILFSLRGHISLIKRINIIHEK